MVFIKKIFRFIFNQETELEEISSFRLFTDMHDFLESEFSFLTLEDLMDKYPERVNKWMNNKIEITHCFSKTSSEIISYILRKYPHSKIVKTYHSLEEVHIKYEPYSLIAKKKLAEMCPIYQLLPSLTMIIKFLNECEHKDKFMPVFDKYTDTFSNVTLSLLEIQESGRKFEMQERKLVAEILNVFIGEFKSMVELYTNGIEREQEAIALSIQNQLKMELEMVNKIKTNWTDVFLLNEKEEEKECSENQI